MEPREVIYIFWLTKVISDTNKLRTALTIFTQSTFVIIDFPLKTSINNKGRAYGGKMCLIWWNKQSLGLVNRKMFRYVMFYVCLFVCPCLVAKSDMTLYVLFLEFERNKEFERHKEHYWLNEKNFNQCKYMTFYW